MLRKPSPASKAFSLGKSSFVTRISPALNLCLRKWPLRCSFSPRQVPPGLAVTFKDIFKHVWLITFILLAEVDQVQKIGYPATFKADTFIPLQPLSEKLCLPYAEKKKILERDEEILEVNDLNKWRPAAPLFESFVIERRPSQAL
ncbi:hypothetical protein SRHO_G00070670 [Serrasalmus rhombeus]